MTFFEYRSIYEIMSINMVEPETPQMTIRHMRGACWISKATHAQAHANARDPTHTHELTYAHKHRTL